MRNRSKLLLAALTATVLLSFAVGSAFARRIEVSNQNFLIKWSPLVFADRNNEHVVSCPVTLDGSFHSRIMSKVSGQLIGHINVAQVGPCTGGTARALTETLPWHVQYNSFEGALPAITGITLAMVGARFNVNSGVECLAGTTQANPGFGRAIVNGEGKITGLRVLEERTIPFTGFICSFVSPGHFSGTGTVTLTGTTTSIIVRLVR